MGNTLKRTTVVDIVGVLIFLLIGCSLGYLYTIEPRPGPWEELTVGNVSVESFAVLYIAQSKDFFTLNNLNVTIKDYSTDATAVDALIKGETDFAGSSEYVVALNAVQKQNISLIASCADSQFVDLISRNDRGITNASDLYGKTVGVAQRTVAEFNLGQFLEANGMNIQDINVVNLAPQDFANAVANGSVDAVVTWEPYTEQVKAKLGSGYADWSLDANALFYSVITCRNDLIANDPETVRRFVCSLCEAEDFIKTHPEETLSLIKNRFNFTDEYMATVTSKNHFTVSLTQTLADVMQSEAAWMINNNLTTQKTAPNINSYINTEGLKANRPASVTINP